MADKIQAVSLITVKTIKKKHLEQISTLFEGFPSYVDTVIDLLGEKPSRIVRGKVRGIAIGASINWLWLVHGPGPDDWRLFEPPIDQAGGTMGMLREKYKDVPQLFVD